MRFWLGLAAVALISCGVYRGLAALSLARNNVGLPGAASRSSLAREYGRHFRACRECREFYANNPIPADFYCIKVRGQVKQEMPAGMELP